MKDGTWRNVSRQVPSFILLIDIRPLYSVGLRKNYAVSDSKKAVKLEHTAMNIDDEIPGESGETGSDELLSEDNLRLPESANILVRVHAVRAWLVRRRDEAAIQVGEAALHLQKMALEEPQEPRMRRRAQQLLTERRERAQQALVNAQERMSAYEEAQALLEDCIAHANGERVLVEYYLLLEERANPESLSHNEDEAIGQSDQPPHAPAWFSAIADVQHRVEHVGIPAEEE